jgi:hypothetical protein
MATAIKEYLEKHEDVWSINLQKLAFVEQSIQLLT